jgi:hypothetical protein
MAILALAADERVADVFFSDDELSVRLMDGRTIIVPLAWYPRLLRATEAQRNNWKISGGGYGIHWPEIDEDLSTEGLLRGAPAPQTSPMTLPEDVKPVSSPRGRAPALLEFLRANRLPDRAKPSAEEIEAQIEEARNSWE